MSLDHTYSKPQPPEMEKTAPVKRKEEASSERRRPWNYPPRKRKLDNSPEPPNVWKKPIKPRRRKQEESNAATTASAGSKQENQKALRESMKKERSKSAASLSLKSYQIMRILRNSSSLSKKELNHHIESYESLFEKFHYAHYCYQAHIDIKDALKDKAYFDFHVNQYTNVLEKLAKKVSNKSGNTSTIPPENESDLDRNTIAAQEEMKKIRADFVEKWDVQAAPQKESKKSKTQSKSPVLEEVTSSEADVKAVSSTSVLQEYVPETSGQSVIEEDGEKVEACYSNDDGEPLEVPYPNEQSNDDQPSSLIPYQPNNPEMFQVQIMDDNSEQSFVMSPSQQVVIGTMTNDTVEFELPDAVIKLLNDDKPVEVIFPGMLDGEVIENNTSEPTEVEQDNDSTYDPADETDQLEDTDPRKEIPKPEIKKEVKKPKQQYIHCEYCHKRMRYTAFPEHIKTLCESNPYKGYDLDNYLRLCEKQCVFSSPTLCLICFRLFPRRKVCEHWRACRKISALETPFELKEDDMKQNRVVPLNRSKTAIICPECRITFDNVTLFHEHILVEHRFYIRKKFSDKKEFLTWLDERIHGFRLRTKLKKGNVKQWFFYCYRKRTKVAEKDSNGKNTTRESCGANIKVTITNGNISVDYNEIHHHPSHGQQSISRHIRNYIIALMEEGYSNREVKAVIADKFSAYDKHLLGKLTHQRLWVLRKSCSTYPGNCQIDLDALETADNHEYNKNEEYRKAIEGYFCDDDFAVECVPDVSNPAQEDNDEEPKPYNRTGNESPDTSKVEPPLPERSNDATNQHITQYDPDDAFLDDLIGSTTGSCSYNQSSFATTSNKEQIREKVELLLKNLDNSLLELSNDQCDFVSNHLSTILKKLY